MNGKARALLAFIASLLMAVGTVALTAGPASAHHPIVSGKAVCNPQTGKYDITWTIGNSERDKTMTYTSRLGGGTVTGGGAPDTKSESVSSPGTYKLKVDASWTNGVRQSAEGSVQTGGECSSQPDDKVTYTEWADGNKSCESGTVTQTRTKTVTPYKWNGSDWVLDEANATSSTETQTRDMTAEELKECAGDQPDDKVTYTEWADGNKSCESGTVTQTRTKTVTPYKWNGSDWVLDEANATSSTETQTRDMTAEELEACEGDEEPDYYLETWHEAECGQVTIYLRNVSPWIYPVSYSLDGSTPDANGPKYGPVVDNRGAAPDDQTGQRTISFQEDSGVQTVKYVVAAGTESDLYQGQPVGEVTTVEVETNCESDFIKVTPEPPTFTDQCGTENDTYTIPSVEGVVYEVYENGANPEETMGEVKPAGTYPGAGEVFIVALPTEGYEIGEGYDWSYTFTDEPCPPEEVPVPAQPDVNDPCGPDNASWVMPQDTDEVTWTLREDGHLVAETTEGYEFDDGTTMHDYGVAKDSGEECPPGEQADNTYSATSTCDAFNPDRPLDANGTISLTVNNTDDETDQSLSGYVGQYYSDIEGDWVAMAFNEVADGESDTVTFENVNGGADYDVRILDGDDKVVFEDTVTVEFCDIPEVEQGQVTTGSKCHVATFTNTEDVAGELWLIKPGDFEPFKTVKVKGGETVNVKTKLKQLEWFFMWDDEAYAPDWGTVNVKQKCGGDDTPPDDNPPDNNPPGDDTPNGTPPGDNGDTPGFADTGASAPTSMSGWLLILLGGGLALVAMLSRRLRLIKA